MNYQPLINKSAKSYHRSADELFHVFFNIYKDLNAHIYRQKFFASVLTPEDNLIISRQLKLIPMFISQIGLLYNICPFRFKGMLSNGLIDFLSVKFRKNTIFLITEDGFMTHIMVMQTSREDRIEINRYFAHHLTDLNKYQYFTTEYEPLFDKFKLLTAKPSYEKNAQDILLTFK
jgi:hypothetical protein